MQIHSPETKVGLFSLIALAILFTTFFWLNGAKFFQNGYELEAVFDRIEGLRPGAPVKFNGVDIGRINQVYFENYRVIVAMRIQPEFQIPDNAKAIIASAGLVGDKYLELVLAKPGELTTEGTRIKGQSPYSMDQLFESAYGAIESIREVADSIKGLADEEHISSLKSSIARIDRITSNLEHLTGGPEIQELIQNLNLATSELANAGSTANRFLTQLEADGETAIEIKKVLSNVEKITVSLDAFTSMMATNGPEVELLVQDARQTLQTINKAVNNINKAIEGLTSEEGDPSQVRQNIKAAAEAAGKISEYVASLNEFSIDNNVGAGHQDENGLIVDYRMDVHLNNKNMLLLGVEDIGEANLTSFQFGVKSPNSLSRFGLYRNEVGLGFDYLPIQTLTLGVDVWDTESANLGLSSAYHFNEDWSVKFSALQNLDTTNRSWTIECWRKF